MEGVNLMETDDDSDNDYESKNDSDREFMNDVDNSDEADASFYRNF